jgi:hypothetical protein
VAANAQFKNFFIAYLIFPFLFSFGAKLRNKSDFTKKTKKKTRQMPRRRSI